MKFHPIYLFVLSLVVLSSCSKDEEAQVNLEPIAILTPSTNPANTSKGQPISYKVEFTTSNYIDSIYTSYQVDSSILPSWSSGKDSIIAKDYFMISPRSNKQKIETVFMPPVFPPTGKVIYMTFVMYSGGAQKAIKTLKLEVL